MSGDSLASPSKVPGGDAVADRIALRGLRAVGTHGVLDEERRRPQPFEVDVEITADLSTAGRTDRLGDTIDYGAVTDAVVAVLTGEHSDLLEHLAQRVVDAAFAASGPRAVSVAVTLRKLRPPVAADLAVSEVSIVRSSPTASNP